MWLVLVRRAFDGDMYGKAIPICRGCAVLLDMAGKGSNSLVVFSPGSATEEALWGVLFRSEDEAQRFEGIVCAGDRPSASKRFPGEQDEESERNRRAEERAVQRNRAEDRRAKMKDRE